MPDLWNDADAQTWRERLSSLGFPDPKRALQLARSLASTEAERDTLRPFLDELLLELSESFDAERALLNLSRLLDATPREELLRQLRDDAAFARRLSRFLSFSQALCDDVISDTQLLSFVRAPQALPSRAQLRRDAFACPTAEALRAFKRRATLQLAVYDLERQTWRDERAFSRLVRGISDLAQVCVQASLNFAARELSCDTRSFCVLAMGKLGARELNYSSDIDLIFLHDGHERARELGDLTLKILAEPSRVGQMYRVDTRLRPDGGSGPLVTPLSYALSYYESYAGAWEHQALIKARAIAGDARLGRRFLKFTRQIVWAKRADDAHLREVVRLKRRAEAQPEGRDATNVKTGPGGIRDVEWACQFTQLLTGPSHPRARASATLRALHVLHEFDALSERELRDARESYGFLRVLEHRLQLRDEKAVRTLPRDERELAALSRRMGFSARALVAARELREELARHQRNVRELCERLVLAFRDPVETEPAPSLRLERLAAGTPTHPLPAPLSRQIRAVLPGALRGLEFAADTERALSNLERLADASGNRLSLLRDLERAPNLSRAVFALLGGSETLSDTLIRAPELLELAANRNLLKNAKPLEQLRAECRAYSVNFQDRRSALRRFKRRETLRIGLRDLALDENPHIITRELSSLAQACLEFADEQIRLERRPVSERVAFAALGMGKLGGGEMHYASDCDVIWLYQAFDDWDEAGNHARRRAEGVTQFLSERTSDGLAYEVDARLRPMGASGPLCPPVTLFFDYFEREAGGIAVWERQALTRARSVSGDRALAARLLAAVRVVAHPAAWRPEWSDELRHIKTRVENERGAKPSRELVYEAKLGRGALSDIEWTAQWLSLKHGHAHTSLQVPNTRAQLEAARETGVLPPEAATQMLDAHTFLRRAELRRQITQSAGGAVRANTPEFARWSRAVFPDEANAPERFAREWNEHTRVVRQAFEQARDAL